MSFLDRFPWLRAPLLRSRGDLEEQQRLLKLYWNRAEIKRELSSLDDALYETRERLKQQLSTTERAHHERESLEAFIGNADHSLSAVVHFQLCALWRACHGLLAQFAQELHRQQEERERKRQLAEFQRDREDRVRLAERRVAEAAEAHSAAEAKQQELRTRHAELAGLWYYFRRRQVAEDLAGSGERLERARQYLADMRAAKRTVEKEPLPEFGGIALDGRRMINLAVIAYAQLMYLRLAGSGLAARARIASRETVYEASYGAQAECLALMREITLAHDLVRVEPGIARQIRERGEAVKAAVAYAHPRDAVPEPLSLPEMPGETAPGVPLRQVNVLLEDYWDLASILLT